MRPRTISLIRSTGSCAICGGGLAGLPQSSCPTCRTTIHAECEAWTCTCPTFGCRGALGRTRRVVIGLPPPGSRSSFAPQPRPEPQPPRQPQPIPVEAPGDDYDFACLWEPLNTRECRLAILWLVLVGVLAMAGWLPVLEAQTRGARVLVLLALWAQATRTTAELANAAGDGLGNLKR